MASKLLVIFGVTGQQGGSVANYVLNDPELSKHFRIRGVARDIDKPAGIALKDKGIELVKGDLDDEAAVKAAVHGAHTVFLMTLTIYDEHTAERELRRGKAVADAAVSSGADYFIYSTEWPAVKVSGGKYPVASYDAKSNVEQYVRSLPIKAAFVAPATFMQNLLGMLSPKPSPSGDGTYVISNIVAPDAKFPWLDVSSDLGKFVGAILAEQDKYHGKTFAAAEPQLHSMAEVAALISRLSGKTVKYNQLPEATFRGFLPPAGASIIVNMFFYIQDFGYYGPETQEVVKWSAELARGKVTTFEEYLSKKPFILQ